MPNHINRSKVIVDFKDIYGDTISDDVEIKIYNTQLLSLKQVFEVKFRGGPETLPDVPAFPTGHAQMIVTPTKYRFKQRFINVQAGHDNHITEYFFVDPSQAHPQPIAYDDLAAKSYGQELLRILRASEIDGNAWDNLDPRNIATILNLSAKMRRETVEEGTELISFVQSIDRTWLDLKHPRTYFCTGCNPTTFGCSRIPPSLLWCQRRHAQVSSELAIRYGTRQL